MVKKICLFLLLLLVLISAFCAFRAYKTYQEMADLYVDSNYKGRLQWGSEKHPYNNIPKAFEAARKKTSLPVLHLKNGEYPGNFEIPENMKIYGESREGVIIKNDDLSVLSTVKIKNNSLLSGLTILGEITGILAEGQAIIENCHISGKTTGILAKGQISIENCSILDGAIGILAERQAIIENCSVKEFKKIGISASPSESEIVVKNSEISNSSGKGFYFQKGRKIQIIGNFVHDNKEEGIDLRQELSGEIRNNEIYKNGESGIELIVGKSSLEIKENKIWDNGANGIVFQYYDEIPEKGTVLVSANYIKSISSEEFAISVKSPSGGEGRVKNYWRNSITITSDNILEGGIKTRSLEITKK